MSKLQAFRRRSVLLAAVAASSASLISNVTPASAATVTWNGGGLDGNWTTALNWAGAVAPVANDALVFDGFGRLTTNANDFAAGTTFSGLTFNSSAGAFTLAGNQVTLGGDLTDNTAILTQIVNNNLVVGATRNVNVASTGTLRLGGIVSGAGGLTKGGDGILILGGANTYAGTTTINAGRAQVSSDGNLGTAPGAATAGSLVINGTGGTLQTTASFTLNANRGIALGPTGGAGSGTIDVNSGTTLTYNGIIANNTGGTGSLIKTSFGTISLGGGNTYTGATQVRNGAITLNFANAGAPTSNIINSASALTIGGATSGLGQQSNASLNVTGRANTAVSQTFASTAVDLYGSVIQVTPGTGTGTATLNLGSITRTLGGTLVVPSATGATVNTTTTVGGTNGILGGWAVAGTANVQRGITLGTDWATVDGTGKIIPYTGYTASAGYTDPNPVDPNNPTVGELAAASLLRNQAGVGASANVRYTGTGTATEVRVDQPNANRTTDINTFAFTVTTASNTLGIGQGNTLRLGAYGGIYKQSTANFQMYIGGPTNGVPVSGNGTGANIGSLTAGGAPNTPGEIVLTLNELNNNNGGLNILASIVDNGTGPVTLIKTGVASVKIDGHNTYSGGTFINQGRFQMAGGEAGAPNPDGLGTGTVTVAPGGYLFVSSVNAGNILFTGPGAIPGARMGSAQNAPVLKNMVLSGNGTSQEAGGSIRLGNRSVLTGQMMLAADTRWFAGNAQAYLAANADGTNPTASTFYFDPGNDFTGKITGPGSIDFGGRAVAGFNGQISNSTNDYTGTTRILATNGNARLRLGNNNVIPDGVGKGNVIMGENTGSNTGVLDMQGFSDTINGLSTEGGTAVAQSFVENNGFTATVVGAGQARTWQFAGTTSTLTVGNFNQSATFGGIIRDYDPAATVNLPNPIYDGDPNTGDTDPNDTDGDAPTLINVVAPWATPNTKVAITKIGSGVQILTGTNTYTGATNITGGVLAVNGSLVSTGAVNVSNAGSAIAGTGSVGNITTTSGGGVSPGATGTGSIGTLTANSLSMTNGDLKIDFGATTDAITVTGAAAFAGANTITPSGAGVTGTYTILTAGGGVTGGGTLTLGAFPTIPNSRPVSGTIIPSASDIKVQVQGAKVLTWTGATNANWELGAGGSLNWTDSVINEKFFNADVVNFNDGPTNRTLALNIAIQPGAVNFNNSAGNDYTVGGTGSLVGLGGISKNNSGTATVNTNNTFTGTVNVIGGTLVLGGSNTPGSVAIGGGSTLVVTGSVTPSSTTTNNGMLRIGAAGTSGSFTGAVVNNDRLFFNRTDNFTHTGVISGGGNVNQVGGGSVTLSAANTYTGETFIDNGTVTATSFASFGSVAAGTAGPVNVNPNGAVDLAGFAAANVANGFGANKLFRIQGTGVAGGGALTNTGANSQTNAFSQVQLVADASIGGTARFDFRNGGPVLNLQGFTLTKNGINQTSIVAGQITDGNLIINQGVFGIETTTQVFGGGTVTVNPAGTLMFHQLGGIGGMDRQIALAGGTIYDNNQTNAVDLLSPINITADSTVNINNSTGFSFSGAVTGTGGITKTGNGRLVLNNAGNTFSGPMNIGGGKLDLPFSSSGTSGITATGGTIELTDDLSANKAIKTGTVTMSGTGKIDIKNNKLISTSPVGTGVANGGNYTDGSISRYVQTASNGGGWDGAGITTSMPDATAGLTSIGVALASDVRDFGVGTTLLFAGQTITPSSTLAMYTYAGDANLDGQITGDDYSGIDFTILDSGNTGGWFAGDFNYDGFVSGDDYSAIDFNILAQGAPFPSAGSASSLSGVTAVPEPASLTVLGLGAAALVGRRRRRAAY